MKAALGVRFTLGLAAFLGAAILTEAAAFFIVGFFTVDLIQAFLERITNGRKPQTRKNPLRPMDK